MGFQTITATNKNYDKARASTAERMIQTIRNLQKPLIRQLESEAKFRLPGGHCLRYWAVMHPALLQVSCAHSAEDHTVSSCDWTTIQRQTGQFRSSGAWSRSQSWKVQAFQEKRHLPWKMWFRSRCSWNSSRRSGNNKKL